MHILLTGGTAIASPTCKHWPAQGHRLTVEPATGNGRPGVWCAGARGEARLQEVIGVDAVVNLAGAYRRPALTYKRKVLLWNSRAFTSPKPCWLGWKA